MKTKSLISCNTTAEAHIIKGRLDADGIECFLTNENFTDLIMPLSNTMLNSGVQVIVKENDFDKASIVIKDMLEPNNEIIVCPHCGSADISLSGGREIGFKLLNMLRSILTIDSIGNMKTKYYCNNCKKEIG